MADDKKISELVTLSPVADDDLVVVVDISDTTMSATGTTKKALKSELKGDKGDTGTAATADAGTTTTGAAGTDASVVNSGTTSSAVFDFTIPRGDKGETGDNGTSCTWKGDWVTSTVYSPQDIVSINSTIYVCLEAHTSGTFATDLTAGKWEIACKSLYWRGAYDNGTAYILNDGVSYNGSSYICTADTTGNIPTDTSYWNILASRGTDGSGDVTGPATNTADYIPQWDGANSKTLKNGLAVPAGGLAGITALNAKVEDSIVDGHTTIAPSGNAVYDALLLKAPIASPTFTGLMTGKSLKEGEMENGHITVTVNSGNLTVTLQHEAEDGTLSTPSATKPVRIKIGGVVRSITGALSITRNAGANTLNLGSAELATKEVDLFTYLTYCSAGEVVLVYGRIPYAKTQADFNMANETNEKAGIYGTNSGTSSTDPFVNIGRFAATLSAGPGYTWSVPTFTASNLIQRPVYKTRKLLISPTIAWSGTAPTTLSYSGFYYQITNNKVKIQYYVLYGSAGSTNTGATLTLPFSVLGTNRYILPAQISSSLSTVNLTSCILGVTDLTNAHVFCSSVNAKEFVIDGEYFI